MQRREFITLLGSTAATWPLTGLAQQSAVPVIGLVRTTGPNDSVPMVAAFRQGLKEVGFIEGQNVAINYRWAEGRLDRLPALVSDLIDQRVTVLLAGGNAVAQVAKKATSGIPVVFVIGEDPVKFGLVAHFNRPGGNLTGVTFLATQLEEKRLGLLHELVPNVPVIAALLNPASPTAQSQARELDEAARVLGLRLHVVYASKDSEIDTAFATLVQRRVGALVVGADPFLFSRREQLVALAARHAMPAMYEWRDFTALGGLASYGTNLTDAYLQAGLYTGRILKGEKPADLPVVQATKFEFVINLKTAKALGLEVAPTLSARADDVIE